MRCDFCQGSGMDRRLYPCENCGGYGIVSCCDGKGHLVPDPATPSPSTCFEDGFKAGIHGYFHDVCPYGFSTNEGVAWDRGHRIALEIYWSVNRVGPGADSKPVGGRKDPGDRALSAPPFTSCYDDEA